MSLQVIITGKLTRNPQFKTSKQGNPYVWMLLSVPTEQERLSASVLGFEQVAETMGKLNEGDEVAVTGTASINEWDKGDGTTRISLNVMASQVMTLYQHRKKKKRFEAKGQAAGQASGDFDDDIAGI